MDTANKVYLAMMLVTGIAALAFAALGWAWPAMIAGYLCGGVVAVSNLQPRVAALEKRMASLKDMGDDALRSVAAEAAERAMKRRGFN